MVKFLIIFFFVMTGFFFIGVWAANICRVHLGSLQAIIALYTTGVISGGLSMFFCTIISFKEVMSESDD